MEVPDSLRDRVELFRQGGYIYKNDAELFTVDSWISVMLGQRIQPQSYHHFARVNDKELKEFMTKHRAHVASIVNALPTHADFVKQYCNATESAGG
jgi:tryptophan halogenase